MNIIRSYLFDFVFYIVTFIYLTLFLPVMLLMPRWFCESMFRGWSHICLFCLKHIVGITFEVRGYEKYLSAREKGPVIIASKHQSAFETIVPSILFKDFIIILKRELFYFPVFGLYLWKLKSIGLNRSKGMQAIKKMLHDGRAAIKSGSDIYIFPEGTRSIPGTSGKYQPGISILYKLDVPVVPVALNSGCFWGRRAIAKKPGNIVFEFLDPIEPGLDKKEFMELLESRLEEKSLALFHESQQLHMTKNKKVLCGSVPNESTF
jgi:1-acyl-sn-glycerol-3-phosphate acyltransferase